MVPGGSNTHKELLHWPQASTAAFIRIQCGTAQGADLAREKRVLAKTFLHLTNPWLSKSLLEPLAADSKKPNTFFSPNLYDTVFQQPQIRQTCSHAAYFLQTLTIPLPNQGIYSKTLSMEGSTFTKMRSCISKFPSNTLGRNKGSHTDRKVILQDYCAVFSAKGQFVNAVDKLKKGNIFSTSPRKQQNWKTMLTPLLKTSPYSLQDKERKYKRRKRSHCTKEPNSLILYSLRWNEEKHSLLFPVNKLFAHSGGT